MELHQRYLVRGEDVLNEWHMETSRRRTGSAALHGPYIDPPETQKVPEGQITVCCLNAAAPLLPEWLPGTHWESAGQVTRPGGANICVILKGLLYKDNCGGGSMHVQMLGAKPTRGGTDSEGKELSPAEESAGGDAAGKAQQENSSPKV